MYPSGEYRQLHIPGDDSGEGRAFDTHFRRAEVAENQHIVETQVYQHRNDSGQHGQEGVAAFLQGAGVGRGDGEGQEAPEHDGKIL